MNVKLIVTDLDNTLLRRDKTVSDFSCDVFRRCRERGILTAFATARGGYSIPSTGAADITIDGGVYIGGAEIRIGGELVKDYVIEPQIVNTLLSEFAANHAIYRFGARCRGIHYTTNPTGTDLNTIHTDFSQPITEPVQHMSFRSADSSIAESVKARFPQLSIVHVSGEELYDINPKEATKANGVRLLAERFNVVMSDIAAFGDDWNDVEMLRECGVGVAVSNAIDACKAAAGYICGDCDDDGIAHWIEENIL